MTAKIIAEPCDGSNGFDVEVARSEKSRRKFRIFERDRWRCVYCERRLREPEQKSLGGYHRDWATIDHVVPKSRGGSNKIENLVTSCMACNNRKKDLTAEEFIQWKMVQFDWEEGRL